MSANETEAGPNAIAQRLAAAGITLDLDGKRTAAVAPVPRYRAEAADPRCLAPEELDLLLAGAPWQRIVALGDSVAEGLGDPVDGYETHAVADRLVAAIRRQRGNVLFCNLAERYLTVAQIVETQLERALALAPELALLVAGGNDALSPNWDPDALERSLAAVVGPLREAGAEVVAATYFRPATVPPGLDLAWFTERVLEVNGRIRAVAQAYDAILVDFGDSPSFDLAGLYSRDIVHLNMRGHAIVTGAFAKALFARLQPEAAARLAELAQRR